MDIKSIQTISVIAIFLLGSICFCCAESSEQSDAGNTLESDILPSCVFGVKSVTYFLYTRDAPFGNALNVTDKRMPLDPNKSVVFLVHGFKSEANNTRQFKLVKALLNKEDVNVISLDWSTAACHGGVTHYIVYGSAVNNLRVVGKYLANFIAKLVREYQVKLENILLVGHSLGSHVVGFAGKNVKLVLGEKLPRIIALDPGDPAFRGTDCSCRLCDNDAEVVEAYHTSAIMGTYEPTGGVNYYFNGGVIQPGCGPMDPSHARSVDYFTSVVQYSPCFVGTPWKLNSSYVLPADECDSNACVYLSLEAPESTKQVGDGIYYVKTTDTAPFCTLH